MSNAHRGARVPLGKFYRSDLSHLCGRRPPMFRIGPRHCPFQSLGVDPTQEIRVVIGLARLFGLLDGSEPDLGANGERLADSEVLSLQIDVRPPTPSAHGGGARADVMISALSTSTVSYTHLRAHET